MTREKVAAVLVGALLVADLVATGAMAGTRRGVDIAVPQVSHDPETTTTTLGPPIGVFPLTGRPAYRGDADRLQRPALSVKIDNAPDARPQAGSTRPTS